MSEPSSPPVRPGWRTHEQRDAASSWALEHPYLVLLTVYALSRLVALAALAATANWFQTPAGVGHLQPTLADMFGLWDSQWYHRVATQGYPVPLPADPNTGRITYSQWAFFPLFPMLVRAVMATGLSFTAAAVLLNLALGAAGVILVWRIFSLASHASGQPARPRLALVAACMWCLYPATAVLTLPYTEALAAVLIAGSLLALMRQRYLVVAGCVLGAGFTRGVAPALGLAIVVHVLVRWRSEGTAGHAALRRDAWRIGVLFLVTACSAVAWPLIAAQVTGVGDAFLQVQAAWGQRPTEGPFRLWLRWAWAAHGLFGVIVMVSLVGTYLSLILGRHGRWLPLEARAWGVAYPLYLFAVVRPITSMWRFLLLDFPITALVASVAMRTSSGQSIVRHWRVRVAVIGLVLVGGVFWWCAVRFSYTPWTVWPP